MKKNLYIVLIAIVALLAGCGSNARETSTPITQAPSETQNKSENQTDIKNSANHETALDMADNEKEKKYEQPEMSGEITVSTLFEQEFLTAAAEKFMAEYPNVKVTINVYRNETGEFSIESYRTYLNTKIMTGKAEDIIFTSNLPVKKYTDMGVFEDLSWFLSASQEINDENYFMNVLEAPRDADGKLYVLPLMSRFDVAGFDNRLAPSNSGVFDGMKSISFEKASEYARQLIDTTSKKNAYLLHANPRGYLSYVIKDNFKDFIDIDTMQSNLNSEQYIALLYQVKELSDNGYFAADGSIDFYNMEYYFALNIQYDVQAAFFNLDPNSWDCYALPLSDAHGNVFTNSNNSLGINSASSKKELAWEFIKYLLSDEIQSLPSFYGLGVNKKGFDASVERNFAFYDENNKGVDKEDYRNLLEQWVMQINAYDTLDPIIVDFLDEENGKFFEGKQTAEETARILQTKIDKYFHE